MIKGERFVDKTSRRHWHFFHLFEARGALYVAPLGGAIGKFLKYFLMTYSDRF